MRYHFIDYADASFKSIQDAQLRAVQHVGIFDTVYGYTRDWLTTTPFYRSYRTVLDMPRGGGYWAWKPYAILDAMSRAEPRSIIVYMDAGDRITRADLMRDVINQSLLKSDIGLRLQGEPNSKMTKRDCFVRMGCDSERFWRAKQPEAGFVVLRNTELSRRIVTEWLIWCRDPNVLTDVANIGGLPNFSDFMDHRHDQSILTNLTVKYDIPINEWLHYCVDTNVTMPEIPVS